MPSLPASLAQHLKSAALFEAANSASVVGAWGDLARSSEIISPLHNRNDAAIEAARQLALLNSPVAEDSHIISGIQNVKVGEVIEVIGDGLDYVTARRCIVRRMELDYDRQQTRIIVERPLL
jgi:hypothetical protein